MVQIRGANQDVRFGIRAHHIGVPVACHIHHSRSVDRVVFELVLATVHHQNSAVALHVRQGHFDLGFDHGRLVAQLSCELLVIEFAGRVFFENAF